MTYTDLEEDSTYRTYRTPFDAFFEKELTYQRYRFIKFSHSNNRFISRFGQFCYYKQKIYSKFFSEQQFILTDNFDTNHFLS